MHIPEDGVKGEKGRVGSAEDATDVFVQLRTHIS